jgi:hypothetical protein
VCGTFGRVFRIIGVDDAQKMPLQCPNLYPSFQSMNHILSIRSPATEPVVDDGPEELKPFSLLSKSWTATLGTWGTGSFRCVPSVLDMISLIVRPLLGVFVGWAA